MPWSQKHTWVQCILEYEQAPWSQQQAHSFTTVIVVCRMFALFCISSTIISVEPVRVGKWICHRHEEDSESASQLRQHNQSPDSTVAAHLLKSPSKVFNIPLDLRVKRITAEVPREMIATTGWYMGPSSWACMWHNGWFLWEFDKKQSTKALQVSLCNIHFHASISHIDFFRTSYTS